MNDEFEEDLGAYFDDGEDEDCFGLALKGICDEPEFAVSESAEPKVAQLKSTEPDVAKPSTSSGNGNYGPEINFNFDGNLFYDGPEADGFFLPTGSSYYYPTNFPVRDYQKSIIETALFNNTLVVLPTGLGKTFIAAVVMYNFYRWYPRGLIVFMAPTRPLVTQQINACTDIMGIPLSDITEITGKSDKALRIESWKDKRIFFVTPHVMVNDITNNYCDPSRVRCIIVDEAHKASGNYAYCQVVRQLSDYFLKFRIVALSATPGNNVEAYQEVVHNLNIAKIQVRADDSPDVAKYVHGRKLTHIVLKLDDTWKQFQDKFLQLYEDYSRVLKENSVVRGNISSLTAFQIKAVMEQFKMKKDINQAVKNKCNMSLLACSTLAHAHSLLYTYGFKAMYSYFSGESDSVAVPIIRKNEKLQSLLRAIDSYLIDNGSPLNYVPSHPKFVKLREVVANHFASMEQNNGHSDSKVIIYCQFRVGVTEAHAALKELEPLIRPVMFIGQSSGKKGAIGLGQKVQLEILNNFKSGKFNTLIATSIGEEGLDIGEVDLIICLDAQSSVTRHIQRIGRTGRKRAGACVFLVTEGKEEAKFLTCLSASSTFNKMIDPKLLNTSVTGANPRMIPKHITPKLHFVHIKPSIVTKGKGKSGALDDENDKPSKGKKGKGKSAALNDEDDKPSKVKKGKSKSAALGNEEVDGEPSTSTKGAPKRKKGSGNNEEKKEKKEKPSKKAKIEKPPSGRTLFSYFTKKNFESFNGNDDETKDVFSTPKDKQLVKSKSKTTELDMIDEEDCAIIEENDFCDVKPVSEAKDVPNLNSFDLQVDLEEGPSKRANDSENQNEIEHMFYLFQNWVTNYAQNDDVLMDENFVQLVRLFMKKPSNSVPTLVCDLNVNTRAHVSSSTDYGINFDSSSDDELCQSPIVLSRKPPFSSPVKIKTEWKNQNYEIHSPVLSYSKTKAVHSPVHFNSIDNAHHNSPMMLQDGNELAAITSTPKFPRKHTSVSINQNEMSSSKVLDQILGQQSPQIKIENEAIPTSPSKPITEDSNSSSPLILTCKMSKLGNPGTSKKLFPDENFVRNDAPLISECNIKQVDKEYNKENVEQLLSDSFDMFLGNYEEDFPPPPTADENLISCQNEVFTQKDNNVLNSNLDSKPKTAVLQEEVAAKSSLLTTIHSKEFQTKKIAEESDSCDKILYSTETVNNKASEVDNAFSDVTIPSKSTSVSNNSVLCDKNSSSVHKISTVGSRKEGITSNTEFTKITTGNSLLGVISDFDCDDSLFENLFVDSAIKVNNKTNNNKSEKLSVGHNTDKLCQFSNSSNQKSNMNLKPSKPAISSINHKTEATCDVNSSEFGFLLKKTLLSSSLSTKTTKNSKNSLLSHASEFQCPTFKDDSKVKEADVSSTYFQHLKERQNNHSCSHNSIAESSHVFNGESKIREINETTSKLTSSHVIGKQNNLKKPEESVSRTTHNSSASNYVKSSGNSSFSRGVIQGGVSKNESKDSSFLSDLDDSDTFCARPRPVKLKTNEGRPRKTSKEKLVPAASAAKKKPKKKRSDFIEYEAEVSGSDVSEDENEDDDENQMPDSFIHDGHNTMLQHEQTMTAQYLESIKSPPNAPGRFKIPVFPNKVDVDVFSQAFDNDADYQNDSFCVDEEVSEGYDCSEEDELFGKNSKTPARNSKKRSKRKRIKDSSSSHEDIVLVGSSSDKKINGVGSSEVVYIPSESSDEENRAKKKPTRRKTSHSAKFSKFKKMMEAKKSRSKPGAESFKGESSRVLMHEFQSHGADGQIGDNMFDSDDCGDFLPRPRCSRVNAHPKISSCMETSIIGRRIKKKLKSNLFSSDED